MQSLRADNLRFCLHADNFLLHLHLHADNFRLHRLLYADSFRLHLQLMHKESSNEPSSMIRTS